MLGSTSQVFCRRTFYWNLSDFFFLMIRQRLWPLRIKHKVPFHSYHIHFLLVGHPSLPLLEC